MEFRLRQQKAWLAITPLGWWHCGDPFWNPCSVEKVVLDLATADMPRGIARAKIGYNRDLSGSRYAGKPIIIVTGRGSDRICQQLVLLATEKDKLSQYNRAMVDRVLASGGHGGPIAIIDGVVRQLY